MDTHPEPFRWEASDEAFLDAIESESGHAVVGLKTPASQRTAEAAGRRAALPSADFQAGLAMLEARGVEILYVYRSFGAVYIRSDAQLALELRDHPRVDYLEPATWGRIDGVPADPAAVREMVAAMGSQVIPWGIEMVRAPYAWQASTGVGVKIGFIDTGINPHFDLPTIPSSNCGGEFNGCADGPVNYHGTHVAGIALARYNTIGVVGVAHGVSGTHVYSWGACYYTGDCAGQWVAAAIDAFKIAGVRVINLSLQVEQSTYLAAAVSGAWNAGAVLVAAAGNRRENAPAYVNWPASYSQVIAVSGVRPNRTFASSSPCPHPQGNSWASNYGSYVELSAPFWALSTVQNSAYHDENQGYCGTSMATAHVSGAAALVFAKNPGWSNQQVRDKLRATADDRGPVGWDQHFGYGIVDAMAAVDVAPQPPPPPPLTVTIEGPGWPQADVVRPFAQCLYKAVIQHAMPPFTFEWTVGRGNVVGTDQMIWYTSGGSNFTIEVKVTNGAGSVGYGILPMQVNALAPECIAT